MVGSYPLFIRCSTRSVTTAGSARVLVSPNFTEQELIDLTLAITNINAWNRLNIAFRTVPGNYRPGMFKPTMDGAEAQG